MKKFYIFLILIFFILNSAHSNEIKILYKLENEIITSQDIVNEINYLVSLNNNLSSLEKNKLNQIATNSAIKEKIKHLELIKFFKIDENNKEIDEIVFNELNRRLNIKDINTLNKYFSNYNLDLDLVKYKIRVELFWNKLIYDKYNSKILIDKIQLRNKILKDSKSKEPNYEYFLREIFFDLSENENLNEKYDKILRTINQTGFENAANIYSLSGTSKFGGEIGWINRLQLSDKIIKEIDNLSNSDITNYIVAGNGYLIIKVEKKRMIETKINIDNELKTLIQKETDRQLNQFSINFFNKLKKNIFIYEL